MQYNAISLIVKKTTLMVGLQNCILSTNDPAVITTAITFHRAIKSNLLNAAKALLKGDTTNRKHIDGASNRAYCPAITQLEPNTVGNKGGATSTTSKQKQILIPSNPANVCSTIDEAPSPSLMANVNL